MGLRYCNDRISSSQAGGTPPVRVFRLDTDEEEDGDEEEADVMTSSIVCFFVSSAVFALLRALLRLELAATHGLHSLPCNVEPSLALTLCT